MDEARAGGGRRRQVELDARGLSIDGERRPLIGAEFHFWRQQAGFWETTLKAIREAGIPLVSTFVCWDFHELEPGRFDFDGATAPERNLTGFLELCAKHGLDVILRPGPIIDAEWETRGPAADVCTLERNDPVFLSRAGDYMAALATAVAPFQAPRGGPIVLVAVDNEIYFPYASDYSWHEEDGDVFIPYHREFAEDSYRSWLRERFASIEELNAAFESAYPSFEEVGAPPYQSGADAEIQASFQFADEYCARYLDTHAATLREHGIEVPFYTNQKQFLAFLDWKRVGESLDSVGLNLCMPNLVPGHQALSMSWFIRLQRLRESEFPWSPEYQAGWIGFDEMYGVISPEHGLYMGLLGAALGLRGMSFFMFVERDDWNWSPINSFGKVRPNRFAAYRELVAVLRELEADSHLADVGLLWSLRGQRAHLANTSVGWEHLFKHWMELEEPKEELGWWRAFERLHEADLDFKLTDSGTDPQSWPRVLVHAGAAAPSTEEIERLATALAGGRTLLSSGRLEPQQMARLSEAGNLVLTSEQELGASIAAAGGVSFVEAGPGLWSFAYRAEGGESFVFVVNPGEEMREVSLAGSLVSGEGGEWEELLSEARGDGGLAAAAASLGPSIGPKRAWVLRLAGEGQT